MDKARNDLSAAVPKFCLALEEHRRTPDGRVRTSQELLATFFPHDEKVCTDRILKHLPNEVRGPIIAAWGIRGIKAALRDNDEKVQSVLHDALIAGDIDHTAFEDGLTAETLVRWVPLGDLWTFWRGGKLTKQAIHKSLSTAYELFLFDARWFLETITAKGGSLKGTDVLADGLSKDDLTLWMRRIHETGDGSPKGIVAALGWDKIVAKTPNEVLIASLDAMAVKVGLVPASGKEPQKVADTAAKPETKSEAAPAAAEPPPAQGAAAAAPKAADAPPSAPKLSGLSTAPAASRSPSKPELKPLAAALEKGGLSGKDPFPSKDLAAAPKEAAATAASEAGVSPPAAPPEPLGGSAEEVINVVLDDEIVSSASPGPGALPAGAKAKSYEEEDEQTMIKAFKTSDRPPPPLRGPTPSRR